MASHSTGPVGPAPQEHQVVYTTLHFDKPWAFDNYLSVGGYQAWKKILAEKPDAATLIEELRAHAPAVLSASFCLCECLRLRPATQNGTPSNSP